MHPFLELNDDQAFEKAFPYEIVLPVSGGGSIERYKQPSDTQSVDVISLNHDHDNLWKYPKRVKTKVLDALTTVLYNVWSFPSRILSITECESLSKSITVYRSHYKAVYHESSGHEVTFSRWGVVNPQTLKSSRVTKQPDLHEIDLWQLSSEALSRIWSPQVLFDQKVDQELIQSYFDDRFQCRSELELDSSSQGIMNLEGMLHPSIYSLEPSPDYLLQDMSSSHLMNVNDHDLLLDRCNLPPRLDTIFIVTATCAGKQEDVVQVELVLSDINSRAKKSVFQSCSLCHFKLTDHHDARKALTTAGRNHHFRAQSKGGVVFVNCCIDTAFDFCTCRLHFTPILVPNESVALRQLHLWKHPNRAKFKKIDALIAQVLYIAADSSASKFVSAVERVIAILDWSETFIRYELFQWHVDHRESFGDQFIGSSWRWSLGMLVSSSTLVQPVPDAIGPFSLQLLFGVLSHIWLMMHSRSELKPPLHFRISISPNIAPQGRCLDEVNYVQLSLEGHACVCALYSPYGILLLRAIVKSMYQTGSDDSHLDRDLLQAGHPFSIRHLSLLVAFVLFVLYCYCYYLAAMRPLDSPRVQHDVVLEAQEDLMIEWEIHRRQQLIRITPLLASLDTWWTNARKIKRAPKALRLKIELLGLHSELGPYWTRFVHRERRQGRRYLPGRLKPP